MIQSLELHSLEDLAKAIEIIKASEPEIRKYLLFGEMGAGKTAFSILFTQSLGTTDEISSPTFTIINEYHTQQGIVYHADLYRLKSVEEALAIGIEDYLDGPNWFLIEWPDIIKPLLYGDFMVISLENKNNMRRISWVKESL